MNITTSDVSASIGAEQVGFDVHKDTISVAVAWHVRVTEELTVEDVEVVSHRDGRVSRWAKSLSECYGRKLKFVYEAGPAPWRAAAWRCPCETR